MKIFSVLSLILLASLAVTAQTITTPKPKAIEFKHIFQPFTPSNPGGWTRDRHRNRVIHYAALAFGISGLSADTYGTKRYTGFIQAKSATDLKPADATLVCESVHVFQADDHCHGRPGKLLIVGGSVLGSGVLLSSKSQAAGDLIAIGVGTIGWINFFHGRGVFNRAPILVPYPGHP